ncbi:MULTISPECIES: peptidase inhibitor family I36 protein [Streptomyces]|uniref:Peptidase inhibitor family I36 n=1 Tax=Streptomyces misionensis TaxID=67331 RepID=A0A1H4YBE9_9ACTN|nr:MULTISPECIES: peptidase inhibitor family I36 protein [Streptomyces]SED15157.1 Peptidase inhibitor family I36 [Streptomyces misionensis]SFY46835.1 hypothetical protein STEPF1_00039 [Streptomyces sp. F-1]
MTTQSGRARGLTVLFATVAMAAACLTPAAQAAPATSYNDCARGLFCVWSGDNGTGQRCEWRVDDADWLAGSRICKWAKGTRVQSAYNHGESGAPVSAYTAADYGGTKMFCLRSGRRANLKGVGTYLRSHTWAC